jgi:hypothetical protein
MNHDRHPFDEYLQEEMRDIERRLEIAEEQEPRRRSPRFAARRRRRRYSLPPFQLTRLDLDR